MKETPTVKKMHAHWVLGCWAAGAVGLWEYPQIMGQRKAWGIPEAALGVPLSFRRHALKHCTDVQDKESRIWKLHACV